MLQLQRKQKTKDGQEVKHQDHFCCTIPCGYSGKRRHYGHECHIRCRDSEKPKKAGEERRKSAGKGKPEGEGQNPGGSPGKYNPGGGRRSSGPPTDARGALNLRVSSRVKHGLCPSSQALAVLRRTRMPKSARSAGT